LLGNSLIQSSNLNANLGNGGFLAFGSSSLNTNRPDGLLNINSSGQVQLQSSNFDRIQVTGSSFATNGDLGSGAAGSQLSVNSSGAILVRNVRVDRADLQSATNMRLSGTLQANSLNVSVGNELIGMLPESEIVINSAGAISAGRIYGNLTDPTLGVEQALTLRSGSQTPINLSISGTNITDAGNGSDVLKPVGVAASLYYPAPQSSRVQIFRGDGAGEVRIIGYSAEISGREGLSSEQIATINSEVAQSQLQLGNTPPMSLLLNPNNQLSLAEPNPGLVSFALTNLSSGLIEGPVLTPGDHLEAVSANLLLTRDDNEKDDVRFWRNLIERVIVWEQD
jgi:hypothetical protein